LNASKEGPFWTAVPAEQLSIFLDADPVGTNGAFFRRLSRYGVHANEEVQDGR
jgi:hypothetical protein